MNKFTRTIMVSFMAILFANLGYSQIPISKNVVQLDTYEDLQFLKKELEGKSIVCLGEQWHRFETYSQIKSRLVKFLHEELGYNIVISETGIYGGLVANLKNLKGKDRLMETFPTIWRTESVLDLVNYSYSGKEEEKIAHFGIDLNGAYTDAYSQLLFDILKNINTGYAQNIKEIDQKVQSEWVKAHRTYKKVKVDLDDSFLDQYSQLTDSLNHYRSALNLDSATFDLLLKTVENRQLLIKKYHLKDREHPKYRDRIMSQNLKWMLEEKFPGQKVIIWAADIHISKKQALTIPGGQSSMIQQLPEELLDKVYALSIQDFKNLPKKVRKKIDTETGDITFYQPNKSDSPFQFKAQEFDGIILCKKVEPIDSFMIQDSNPIE